MYDYFTVHRFNVEDNLVLSPKDDSESIDGAC